MIITIYCYHSFNNILFDLTQSDHIKRLIGQFKAFLCDSKFLQIEC